MSEQSTNTFLLDTNVFIEAHKRYYAMDLCPGFWDCLEYHCQETRVLSIDRVREEILQGDALEEWARQAPSKLFASSAEDRVLQAFSDMVRWVQGSTQFHMRAKEEFARVADGWLIAYAQVHGLVVVTHESFSPNSKRKVPMPNVCQQFGVPYNDTFSMLRSLEVSFGWRP